MSDISCVHWSSDEILKVWLDQSDREDGNWEVVIGTMGLVGSPEACQMVYDDVNSVINKCFELEHKLLKIKDKIRLFSNCVND